MCEGCSEAVGIVAEGEGGELPLDHKCQFGCQLFHSLPYLFGNNQSILEHPECHPSAFAPGFVCLLSTVVSASPLNIAHSPSWRLNYTHSLELQRLRLCCSRCEAHRCCRHTTAAKEKLLGPPRCEQRSSSSPALSLSMTKALPPSWIGPGPRVSSFSRSGWTADLANRHPGAHRLCTPPGHVQAAAYVCIPIPSMHQHSYQPPLTPAPLRLHTHARARNAPRHNTQASSSRSCSPLSLKVCVAWPPRTTSQQTISLCQSRGSKLSHCHPSSAAHAR